MKLCAYHGNLYFDTFQLHVAEMKSKGFDTILFCISETDMLYNLEIFKEFRKYAESQGFYCWATFWGLTAGEALCKDRNVDKWLNDVWEIGFFHVMIDEPKEMSDINKFLRHSNRFIFHLCLTDDTFNILSDEEIKSMPVTSLGLSCYHLGHRDWEKVLRRTGEWAGRLKKLRPNDNFIFIQGFDIPEGWELLPLTVKDRAATAGITNFAFWSFRCTEATGCKRPTNYEMIWKALEF